MSLRITKLKSFPLPSNFVRLRGEEDEEPWAEYADAGVESEEDSAESFPLLPRRTSSLVNSEHNFSTVRDDCATKIRRKTSSESGRKSCKHGRHLEFIAYFQSALSRRMSSFFSWMNT